MSRVDSPLYFSAFGASTPVGRDMWASAAAARAGVCGFSEHPYMVDTAGEPMRIATAPWVDIEIEGVERYAELLLPAIDEAMAGWRGVPARIGVALALPPPRPGRAASLAGDLLTRMAHRYPGRFGPARVFEAGHAGGYLALDAAAKDCDAGLIDACMVCAVDSYLDPETLDWIEACDQLHGAGPQNNAWGFVPGEAAGVVLVSGGGFLQRHGLTPMAAIDAVGIGREGKVPGTDDPITGEGLSQAFRAALDELASGVCIDNVVCDMNGEAWRADEYGFAVLRAGNRLRAATDFVAPADCWGDVGAAGLPLHMALAAIAHLKHYGRGAMSMVWGSSASGERGAAVLHAQPWRAPESEG